MSKHKKRLVTFMAGPLKGKTKLIPATMNIYAHQKGERITLYTREGDQMFLRVSPLEDRPVKAPPLEKKPKKKKAKKS